MGAVYRNILQEAGITVYNAAFDVSPVTEADSHGFMDVRARGVIQRVEPAAVPIPGVAKGTLMNQPAIHARGTLGVDESEFYFVDEAENPLALRSIIGNENLDVIYGICFSFNSDKIHDESEPVLGEIADLLGKHPDWKLNVEGRAPNRRVELVKQ